MRIAIGSDHGGYALKKHIKSILRKAGISFRDLGTDSARSTDYPDHAAKVARAVTSRKFNRGILICGSGAGMAMAANKIPGIRAAVCNDLLTAKVAREHNDANILVLGGRIVANAMAEEILKVWLKAKFTGGRHGRRVRKMMELEKCQGR